jgi:asparagine synthetase B (glutamine-hydrolysing)
VEKLGAEAIAARIRARLDRYMAAIATNYPDAQVFVCLSGGLDSSGVAALATQHFSEVTAVSFDLRRPAQRASEDRVAAERVAHDLGLSLLEATVSEEELFDHLDTVLVEGIDWRDFNVHAALVNAVLAARIEQAVPAHARASALVMTGDLPNEFLVDYRPETYRGTSYYGMPRLKPSALRDILVRGLDTSHREIGVFAAFGLPVVQPYAVAVDDYLALPGELLALEDRKEQLCRKIFGDLLPEYVYSRPKVRAQAGSTDVGGGVLAACVDRGFDQIWLRRRFAALHGVTDPAMLDDFIRAGRYRAAVPK